MACVCKVQANVQTNDHRICSANTQQVGQALVSPAFSKQRLFYKHWERTPSSLFVLTVRFLFLSSKSRGLQVTRRFETARFTCMQRGSALNVCINIPPENYSKPREEQEHILENVLKVFIIFEVRSCDITQVGFKLEMSPVLTSECWYYRQGPLYSAKILT